MKIEIGEAKPDNFRERWPGEFRIFSQFESALGIPHVLSVITTLKENGLPNACFESWSSFSGDGGGFFAITPLCRHTHTYANILRRRQFCVNFLAARLYDACYETVFNNGEDTDEFAVAGFTPEAGVEIEAPRIGEAFLSLECTLVSDTDLSGRGVSSLVIGRVVHAAIDADYINGAERKYGPEGFMFYLNSLRDYKAGNDGERQVGTLHIVRKG